MSLCAREDVFIELSNGPVKRDIRSLLHARVDVLIELSNGPVKRDIRSLLHWK